MKEFKNNVAYFVTNFGEIKRYDVVRDSGYHPRPECDLIIRDANGELHSAKSVFYFEAVSDAVADFERRTNNHIQTLQALIQREQAALARIASDVRKWERDI